MARTSRSVLPPQRRQSPQRERVLDSIRATILTGVVEDGERLVEERLAEELRTSRGPIRDALRQLEYEGLVVTYPYKGSFVTTPTDEEVQRVFMPLRLTLEQFAFVKAVEHMSDDEFAELAKEVWQMTEAARTDDLMRSVEADLRFHEFVLNQSGQLHTAQVWRGIAPRVRAYFCRYGQRGDLQQIADEHVELLNALQTRDPAVIEGVLEQHIRIRPRGQA